MRATVPLKKIDLWLKRWLIKWLAASINTIITRRILDFRSRLIEDGFIPDLGPPYPGRAFWGGTELSNPALPLTDQATQVAGEIKFDQPRHGPPDAGTVP
jgi:hypothetical protein